MYFMTREENQEVGRGKRRRRRETGEAKGGKVVRKGGGFGEQREWWRESGKTWRSKKKDIETIRKTMR